MDQNFSTKLKELRLEHNLSQTDLAEYLHISRQAISRWETGRAYPDIDNIISLCNLYEISADEFLGLSQTSSTSQVPKVSTQESSSNMSLPSTEFPIMEVLCLALILILTSHAAILGISVSIFIAYWLKHSKKNCKIIYILCFICLLIGIYNTFIMLNHSILNITFYSIKPV